MWHAVPAGCAGSYIGWHGFSDNPQAPYAQTMTVHRPRFPGLSSATDRRYRIEVEVEYAGRSVAPETVSSLDRAIRRLIGGQATDITLTVSPDAYSRIAVQGIITATIPLAALTWLDKVVDDALAETGFFEEFDISGKVLHAAPADLRPAR